MMGGGRGRRRIEGGILINIYSFFDSSDSMVAYPEAIVQVRDLVRVLLPLLPHGGLYSGEFVLSSPMG